MRRACGMTAVLTTACVIALLPAMTSAEPRTIQLERFTFSFPAGKGWKVEQDDRSRQAQFTKKSKDTAFILQLLWNTVKDDSLMRQDAHVVADRYRQGELEEMYRAGVLTGQYSLNDVTHGEEQIGGKTFYTMRYVQTTQFFVNRATLYLHFPKPRANYWFVVALYCEATKLGARPSPSALDEALSTLVSLEPR